jgi:hypothetical protein
MKSFSTLVAMSSTVSDLPLRVIFSLEIRKSQKRRDQVSKRVEEG